MNSNTLAALSGVLLSLIFSYVPGLSEWYDAQPPVNKRLIMALSVVVIAAGAFGLSCAGVLQSVACDQAGALGLVEAVISALVANQATFLISPKSR